MGQQQQQQLSGRVSMQVASGDDSGMICLWDLHTGQREGHFTNAHGTSRLTALAFDFNQRRLLTGGADGRSCMFNLNSGSLLQVHLPPALPALSRVDLGCSQSQSCTSTLNRRPTPDRASV